MFPIYFIRFLPYLGCVDRIYTKAIYSILVVGVLFLCVRKQLVGYKRITNTSLAKGKNYVKWTKDFDIDKFVGI